ncbi:MAG: hypothetical protein HPY54_04560 [Chthonomonadetes bacterium]|nr:hypothetical protein [Chthonomonadetes bacterium]
MFPPNSNEQNRSLKDLARQERRLKLQLVLMGIIVVLFAVVWFTDMLDAISTCLTLGCDARVPFRPRRAWSVNVTARLVIGYLLFMLAVVLPILLFCYREIAENLAEVRARLEFERTMERIRAGEDIDRIVQDLKRRRR